MISKIKSIPVIVDKKYIKKDLTSNLIIFMIGSKSRPTTSNLDDHLRRLRLKREAEAKNKIQIDAAQDIDFNYVKTISRMHSAKSGISLNNKNAENNFDSEMRAGKCKFKK